jgi:large subunit ribosomal protein L5
MARLLEKYKKDIVPQMMETFQYRNVWAVPKIEKIVVNMGVGAAVQNQKRLEAAVKDLAMITGQKPIITKARRSVSSFKLRAGMQIGCKVTLRGQRMYEFFDRLISVAIPRIRDFRGLSPKSFDGHGNYSLGLAEQIIFPEIRADKVEHIQGMDVTIVTTGNTDKEAYELLRLFGMPFRRR